MERESVFEESQIQRAAKQLQERLRQGRSPLQAHGDLCTEAFAKDLGITADDIQSLLAEAEQQLDQAKSIPQEIQDLAEAIQDGLQEESTMEKTRPPESWFRNNLKRSMRIRQLAEKLQ